MLWILACQAARRIQGVTRSGYAPPRPGQSLVGLRRRVPGPPRPYSARTFVVSSFGATRTRRCRRTICTHVCAYREHTEAGHGVYRHHTPQGTVVLGISVAVHQGTNTHSLNVNPLFSASHRSTPYHSVANMACVSWCTCDALVRRTCTRDSLCNGIPLEEHSLRLR